MQLQTNEKPVVRSLSATLRPTPSFLGRSLKDLPSSARLEFGFTELVSAGHSTEVRTFARQSAGRLYIDGIGRASNREPIEFVFPISSDATRTPSRLVLFVDGASAMVGSVTQDRTNFTEGDQNRLLFERGAINLSPI